MEKKKYNESLFIYCRFILKHGEKYNLFDKSDLIFRKGMVTGRDHTGDVENRFYKEINTMIKDYADDYALGNHTEENLGFYKLYQELEKQFIL